MIHDSANGGLRVYQSGSWGPAENQTLGLSFAKYIQRFGSFIGMPTHISILLGTNDIIQNRPDFLGNLRAFVNSIKAWNSSATIIINTIMVGGDQNGFGWFVLKSQMSASEFTDRAYALNASIIAEYDNLSSRNNKIFVNPMGHCFDHQSGYLTQTVNKNKYLPNQSIQTDGIHPGTANPAIGVHQMADSLAAIIQHTR
jgi:lysophospholipase L1-like esterase